MLVADWISRQSHTNKNKYEVKSFYRNDSVLAIPRAGYNTRHYYLEIWCSFGRFYMFQ